MELGRLDVITKNVLAATYRGEGLVVIPDVSLPPAFRPPSADFVFLSADDGCEVHIGRTAYLGDDAEWRRLLAQPETAGRTRKVALVRGDFFNALSATVRLLGRAGNGPVPIRPGEYDVPLEDQGRPGQVPGRPPLDADGRLVRLRDLVEESRRQPRLLVGREDILAALKTNLIREAKPGVVLTGRPGVGKSTVVEMLAADIAADRRVPRPLRNTPVYELPLGTLVEGGRYVGDIERRARAILETPGRPIFFLDEIHQLARQELRPLCDLVKPALAAGTIRVIGATTATDWRSLQDNAFKRRFLEITVDEPTPAETFLMVQARAKALAEHHGLGIDDAMIREAIMLAARHVPMRCFPDKAIDILDQAAATQVATTAENRGASPRETP